uniref:Uncharacterized protein n=1 Tax=Pelinobius muticus TaxID=753628 RepID=D5J703_PELMU|nr:hypothetical protein [Pelinobius muticus]
MKTFLAAALLFLIVLHYAQYGNDDDFAVNGGGNGLMKAALEERDDFDWTWQKDGEEPEKAFVAVKGGHEDKGKGEKAAKFAKDFFNFYDGAKWSK